VAGKKGRKDEREHEHEDEHDRAGRRGFPFSSIFNPTRYRARARPRALKVAGKKGRKDECENEHQDEHDRAGRRGFPLSSIFNPTRYRARARPRNFEGGGRKRVGKTSTRTSTIGQGGGAPPLFNSSIPLVIVLVLVLEL
jgi:hypothetical protein